MNQVLVVDDEALEAHFSRDRWDVTTAYGAKDAIAKFRQGPCDRVSMGSLQSYRAFGGRPRLSTREIRRGASRPTPDVGACRRICRL